MDYNSLNLRELTVFDLCTDEKYLNDYFPWGKEAYIRELQQHPNLRWNSMLSLAEEPGYEGLEAAVEKQFAEEIAVSYDE